MSQSIEVARSAILAPTGLAENDLTQVLDKLVSHRGVDNADLYFELSRYESWTLEDGIVKDASYGIDKGVGVRALSGEKTGFAYSDEISLHALEKAVSTVKAIGRQGQSG